MGTLPGGVVKLVSQSRLYSDNTEHELCRFGCLEKVARTLCDSLDVSLDSTTPVLGHFGYRPRTQRHTFPDEAG